jgi:hypothetical protein
MGRLLAGSSLRGRFKSVAAPSRLVLNRRYLSLFLALTLHLSFQGRAQAENHGDYRYSWYGEEADRITVETHAVLFEQALSTRLSLKANYVHDAVSGASPTGAPPPPGSNQVPLAHMDDVRNAGYLEGALRLGRHTLAPQFSYSLEHDYESIGLSISDAIDFNQKNTTLTFGYAHTFDSIFPIFWGNRSEDKNSDDAMIGLTQVLSSKAFINANASFGYASGYLNDPYKGVHFDNYPDPTGTATFPEKRPDYKSKEIAYVAFNYFVDPLNGSAEAGYRFYHDSFGIFSHTAALTWHQKIGKHVVLNPMFRFSNQAEADFYAPRFPGDPQDPDSPIPLPEYYSADYRLSSMHTFTYGLTATWMIKEHFYLDASYQRYEMYGNDNVTSASAYPKANVISGGLRVWW